VPDDVLARVRDSNGIVMVTFVPGFLNDRCRAWLDELMAVEDELSRQYPPDSTAWRELRRRRVDAHPSPPATVAEVADHVEYIREVAGVDAVGLGGDFDGVINTPVGLADVASYPNLLVELADRRWSAAELAKLTWHNAIRVLRDTESAAAVARRERAPSLATIEDLDGVAPLA
jgi:membrane dipeptidase